jgi:hypothetical protein
MYKIIIEVLDIMNNSSYMITSTFFKFTWQELSILLITLLPFIWILDNSKIVNSPVNFEITRFNCIIHILNWPKIHFDWKKKVTYNKTWLSQKKTQRLPGACNRSPGSKLLSITTQLHCGGRAQLPDTILEEDHPMTIPSKFGFNWATGSRQDGFYVNFP